MLGPCVWKPWRDMTTATDGRPTGASEATGVKDGKSTKNMRGKVPSPQLWIDQTRMLPIFQGPFPVFESESITSSFPICLLPLRVHLRSYS